MNSNTSNPDEAKEATDKSTKKNIPGLALLLLDLAVALVGFYIGTHVFWKDQNEESVIVAGAMSAAWATFSWAVFGPMLGRDRSTKFEKGIFLMSMLASWDAGVAMACVNYGGKGTSLSWSGTSLWLLSVGFVYCWYVACAIIVRDVMPSKFRLKDCPNTLVDRDGAIRSPLLRRRAYPYIYQADVRGHVLAVRAIPRILLARWKNRFRSCRLRIPAGMAVRDFLDPVPEERNNRIDHIRQHQGLGSPRQTISSRIHQEKRHQSQSNECGA